MWLGLALCIPIAAAAANLECSIKASKLTGKSDMQRMAKVSDQDARKAAVETVKAPNASIAKGGLEVEDGCVVYSYDVKIVGKGGIDEVIIDAGTGKVLTTEREN